ncbi:hypothetical protein CYLTODRAFT_449677 [Cylindrobasidium torrendii FP15055 ss-10]|uniref:Uncharacterized protein n=1 Tax=Cylindrobasidium torrendii FP15055 ss-10 TaxID=1314674 RepID=A0A0D7BQL9_9AGAR|nr:hypothetical protein CYLTODRAFT_449677 [Cylindrobasidium torrendii FP15055 ss-10]
MFTSQNTTTAQRVFARHEALASANAPSSDIRAPENAQISKQKENSDFSKPKSRLASVRAVQEDKAKRVKDSSTVSSPLGGSNLALSPVKNAALPIGAVSQNTLRVQSDLDPAALNNATNRVNDIWMRGDSLLGNSVGSSRPHSTKAPQMKTPSHPLSGLPPSKFSFDGPNPKTSQPSAPKQSLFGANFFRPPLDSKPHVLGGLPPSSFFPSTTKSNIFGDAPPSSKLNVFGDALSTFGDASIKRPRSPETARTKTEERTSKTVKVVATNDSIYADNTIHAALQKAGGALRGMCQLAAIVLYCTMTGNDVEKTALPLTLRGKEYQLLVVSLLSVVSPLLDDFTTFINGLVLFEKMFGYMRLPEEELTERPEAFGRLMRSLFAIACNLSQKQKVDIPDNGAGDQWAFMFGLEKRSELIKFEILSLSILDYRLELSSEEWVHTIDVFKRYINCPAIFPMNEDRERWRVAGQLDTLVRKFAPATGPVAPRAPRVWEARHKLAVDNLVRMCGTSWTDRQSKVMDHFADKIVWTV